MIAPVYDWSGFYIGVNGGWGSSHNCWDVTTPAGALHRCRKVAITRTAARSVARSAIAGRQRWVFGLEAQGNWADFRGSNISLFLPARPTRSRIDAFGLFTGQIGYAWNNVLLYVKGGAAVTDDKYDIFDLPGGAARRHGYDNPLGRHGRRRSRIRLRAELVGRRRIRPSVHGQRKRHLRDPAGAVRWHRQHPAGRRYGHRSRQLPLGWPGYRQVLMTSLIRAGLSIANNLEKAGLAPAFFVALCALASTRATCRHFTCPATAHPNKPLMACTRHWKSRRVLPMFRAHPLASIPGYFRTIARPNAARQRAWECRHG